MMSFPKGKPAFDRYVKRLLTLHRMIADGLGDADETDVVRDVMDDDWKVLTTTEVEAVDGLSADLYMLQGEEIHEPALDAQRGVTHLGLPLLAARRDGDWERVLELLRCGPDFLTDGEVAYLRAQAYEALRQPDVAVEFLRWAMSRPEAIPTYAVHLHELLRRSGQLPEALRQAWLNVMAPGADPTTVVLSAASILEAMRADPDAAFVEACDRLIRPLVTAVAHPADTNAVQLSIAFLGHVVLGSCLEVNGRRGEAAEEYMRAAGVPSTMGDVRLVRAVLRGRADSLVTADADARVGNVVGPGGGRHWRDEIADLVRGAMTENMISRAA